MATLSRLRYGSESRERLSAATDPSLAGALAALESFYYSLNHRDSDVLRRVWSGDPLAQLNNPLGGMIRNGSEIVALYERIFAAPGRFGVAFDDFVEYSGADHALFAGRETVTYGGLDEDPTTVAVRTSRYFQYVPGQGTWVQLHHHGSIDDADALRGYQHALLPDGNAG